MPPFHRGDIVQITSCRRRPEWVGLTGTIKFRLVEADTGIPFYGVKLGIFIRNMRDVHTDNDRLPSVHCFPEYCLELVSVASPCFEDDFNMPQLDDRSGQMMFLV
jgi:hypothetical protein